MTYVVTLTPILFGNNILLRRVIWAEFTCRARNVRNFWFSSILGHFCRSQILLHPICVIVCTFDLWIILKIIWVQFLGLGSLLNKLRLLGLLEKFGAQICIWFTEWDQLLITHRSNHDNCVARSCISRYHILRFMHLGRQFSRINCSYSFSRFMTSAISAYSARLSSRHLFCSWFKFIDFGLNSNHISLFANRFLRIQNMVFFLGRQRDCWIERTCLAVIALG